MAATMIDYATLCKAIEDWKSGRQPAAAKPPKPARPPSRVPTRPAVEEEEAVEYSAIYETGEPQKEEPAESTVIYQLPDYEGEAEVDIGEDER